MKHVPTILLILAAIFALWPAFVLAQSAECVSHTGSNATVIFPEEIVTDIEGRPIAEGQRLTVHGEDGRCVGELVWSEGAQALTVWGESMMHQARGGLQSGEAMTFRLYDGLASENYYELSLTFSREAGLYQESSHYMTNGIYKVESIRSKTLRLEGRELSPAAPNPFSHFTQVTLTIERSQHVQVHVYDVLGARVAELHNGYLDNGANTLRFHADRHASGTYFIVARGEHFFQSRSVTLVQ